VLGFVVADRFHDLIGSALEFDRAAFPAGIVPAARASFSDDGAGEPADEGPGDDPAWLRDRGYRRALHSLQEEWHPQLIGLRYQALDQVGHRSWSAPQPRSVGEAADDDRRLAAQALERAYLAADAEVGAAMTALAPDDLLLVISGFGMQRLNPLKQMLGELLGDHGLTGTHERAPDGFLLAYGSAVEPGRRPRGSIVDVTPTILYYLGLPVGRDMDGFARSDLFTRGFTAERPIAFIPTHNR
jgi:hypothetical protein